MAVMMFDRRCNRPPSPQAIPQVPLSKAGLTSVGPPIQVAVGESGDADDGAQVQCAATDRGGDQQVTPHGGLRLLPFGVEQDPAALI
jgi:hypothetical protein